MDKIFWEYLEKLPEQETAWHNWVCRLAGWHGFNTFYTHYLKVGLNHAKFLECTTPCKYGCPRQIEENSPSDIAAVCTQKRAEPIQLKFRDILIYSLRWDGFHKALCASLQIEQMSGSKLSECKNTWYLGEHSGTAVYLTYRMTELTETISSLCLLLHQAPFILIAPTGRGLTMEAQELLADNSSVFLSMADELTLQPDGSLKTMRSIAEFMRKCH